MLRSFRICRYFLNPYKSRFSVSVHQKPHIASNAKELADLLASNVFHKQELKHIVQVAEKMSKEISPESRSVHLVKMIQKIQRDDLAWLHDWFENYYFPNKEIPHFPINVPRNTTPHEVVSQLHELMTQVRQKEKRVLSESASFLDDLPSPVINELISHFQNFIGNNLTRPKFLHQIKLSLQFHSGSTLRLFHYLGENVDHTIQQQLLKSEGRKLEFAKRLETALVAFLAVDNISTERVVLKRKTLHFGTNHTLNVVIKVRPTREEERKRRLSDFFFDDDREETVVRESLLNLHGGEIDEATNSPSFSPHLNAGLERYAPEEDAVMKVESSRSDSRESTDAHSMERADDAIAHNERILAGSPPDHPTGLGPLAAEGKGEQVGWHLNTDEMVGVAGAVDEGADESESSLEESSSRLKVLVVNLPVGLTEEGLAHAMRNCGKIRKVHRFTTQLLSPFLFH